MKIFGKHIYSPWSERAAAQRERGRRFANVGTRPSTASTLPWADPASAVPSPGGTGVVLASDVGPKGASNNPPSAVGGEVDLQSLRDLHGRAAAGRGGRKALAAASSEDARASVAAPHRDLTMEERVRALLERPGAQASAASVRELRPQLQERPLAKLLRLLPRMSVFGSFTASAPLLAAIAALTPEAQARVLTEGVRDLEPPGANALSRGYFLTLLGESPTVPGTIRSLPADLQVEPLRAMLHWILDPNAVEDLLSPALFKAIRGLPPSRRADGLRASLKIFLATRDSEVARGFDILPLLFGTPSVPGVVSLGPLDQERPLGNLLRRLRSLPADDDVQTLSAVSALLAAIAALAPESQARIHEFGVRGWGSLRSARARRFLPVILGTAGGPAPGTILSLPRRLQIGPMREILHRLGPDKSQFPEITEIDHASTPGVADGLKAALSAA